MALTREQIVDAALKVASDYGLGDLSMRRVAAELGVQAGALYWHVANKQELLIALSRRLLDPEFGARSWATDPGTILVDFRGRLLALRDGAEILAVAHARAPEDLPPVPQLATGLEEKASGAAMAEAKVLLRWALGSVLAQQTARSLVSADSADDAAIATVDYRFERDFRQGLELLLSPGSGDRC